MLKHAFLFLLLEVARTDLGMQVWKIKLVNPDLPLSWQEFFKAFLCACFNFDARTRVYLDAF